MKGGEERISVKERGRKGERKGGGQKVEGRRKIMRERDRDGVKGENYGEEEGRLMGKERGIRGEGRSRGREKADEKESYGKKKDREGYRKR